MKYTHLNLQQRYQIEARLNTAQPVPVIALALGIDRSTVYRERNRGQVRGRYCARTAHRRALRCKAISASNHPVKPDSVWKVSSQLLRQEWSPEQISGRLHLTGGIAGVTVSHHAIYGWLSRSSSRLVTRLRHHRPPSAWRVGDGGLPQGRPSIRKRPREATERKQVGHWEGDTVRGRTHHHCLVTLVERKSLYTKLSPPVYKDSATVARAVRSALQGMPAVSLTLDNGTEFAAYAAMGVPVYFADPGKPRQRARNENTNGLIRQYVPKQARLSGISRAKITRIEQRLNDRPRKSLGYKTPREVLFNLSPTPVALRS